MTSPFARTPIYGAERLLEEPIAPVVIFASAQSCDAAREILSPCVCLAVDVKADFAELDWAALKNRKITVVSADEAVQYRIVDHVEGVAASVRVLRAINGGNADAIIAAAKDPPPLEDRLVHRTETDDGAPFEQVVKARVAVMPDDKLMRLRKRLKEEAGFKQLTAWNEAIKKAQKELIGDDEEESESATKLLMEIAKSVELFHDRYANAVAKFKVMDEDGGSHRECHKVDSSAFRNHLKLTYYQKHDKVPSGTAIESVAGLLVAMALRKGEPVEVYIRRARVGDKIYIDIGGPKWDAYEVTKDGWRKVDDPPVLFLRAPGTEPLFAAVHIEPKEGIALFEKHTRFQGKRSRVLAVGFMLDALGGMGPHAVLSIIGESGATKTTHALVILSLVDPRAGPLMRPPREERDLYILASQRGVVAYNNMSALDQAMSDAFCTVTEGNVDARRKHYTNDDASLIYAKTPVILTSVAPIITAGDLAAREMQAELAFVPENERLSEDEFWAALREDAPAILGALLEALRIGLRRYSEIKTTSLPRLATLARFNVACETAFWEEGTFLQSLSKESADIADEVVRADPVAASLYAFMRSQSRGEWEGTASDLQKELTRFVKRPLDEAEIAFSMAKSAIYGKSVADSSDDRTPEQMRAAKDRALAEAEVNVRTTRDRVKNLITPDWPTGGAGLSKRLRKFGLQLRSVGIHITWPTHHGDARLIHISLFSAQKEVGEKSPSPLSGASSDDDNDKDTKSLDEDSFNNTNCPSFVPTVPKSSPNWPQAVYGEDIATDLADEMYHAHDSPDRGEKRAEDGEYNRGLPQEETDV
jgi:hypothetical protein